MPTQLGRSRGSSETRPNSKTPRHLSRRGADREFPVRTDGVGERPPPVNRCYLGSNRILDRLSPGPRLGGTELLVAHYRRSMSDNAPYVQLVSDKGVGQPATSWDALHSGLRNDSSLGSCSIQAEEAR